MFDASQIFAAEEKFSIARISKIIRLNEGIVTALEPLVVHEDNHELIIFKPAGWLSQRDATGDLSVNEIFQAYLKGKYQKPGNVFCAAVQRLDRPACGLMVLARTSKAAARISEEIRVRRFEKRYHVLTTRALPHGDNRRKIVLTGDMKKLERMARSTGGGRSSLYALSARFISEQRGIFQYEVEIDSGKFHQIRALFAAHGSPLLGDVKYGGRPLKDKGRRVALVASKISFAHPTLKTPQVFYLAAEFLDNLRSHFV
jgi:23S rRNA pseudouridine1911/1915/1917 synthase